VANRIRPRIDLSDSSGEARNICIRLLAQREHSRSELLRKLAAAGIEAELARQTVDELVAERTQSDARFADVFVRSRQRRGQGPQRLRHELRNRGIGGEDIDDALKETDWDEVLAETHAKKFGHGKPDTPKEFAARMRFLLQRGFSQSAIRAHLRRLGADDETPSTDDRDDHDHD
jgi:regulatory protein